MKPIWNKYKGCIKGFSILACLVCWVVAQLPIMISPYLDPPDYESFAQALTGWRQHYLLPSMDILEAENGTVSYLIRLKGRQGYTPQGYSCRVEAPEQQGFGISALLETQLRYREEPPVRRF